MLWTSFPKLQKNPDIFGALPNHDKSCFYKADFKDSPKKAYIKKPWRNATKQVDWAGGRTSRIWENLIEEIRYRDSAASKRNHYDTGADHNAVVVTDIREGGKHLESEGRGRLYIDLALIKNKGAKKQILNPRNLF